VYKKYPPEANTPYFLILNQETHGEYFNDLSPAIEY